MLGKRIRNILIFGVDCHVNDVVRDAAFGFVGAGHKTRGCKTKGMRVLGEGVNVCASAAGFVS